MKNSKDAKMLTKASGNSVKLFVSDSIIF